MTLLIETFKPRSSSLKAPYALRGEDDPYVLSPNLTRCARIEFATGLYGMVLVPNVLRHSDSRYRG